MPFNFPNFRICQAVAAACLTLLLVPMAFPQDEATPTAQPLAISEEDAAQLAPLGGFQLGIDQRRDEGFPGLYERRVALVTDSTAIDRQGIHTIEHFAKARRFTFGELFLIDDGFSSPTATLESARSLKPDLKTTTLSAENYQLSDECFDEVDFVVFDAALRGPRFTPDFAILCSALEQASLQGKRFILFDRPPVTNPEYHMGPVSSEDYYGSLEAYIPMPLFPGLTAGEVASYFNVQYGVQADLVVHWMKEWRRSDGNGWLAAGPAPNTTARGTAAFEELRESALYAQGSVPLHAAARLAGENAWDRWRLGRERIELLPAAREPQAVLENFGRYDPPGVDMTVETLTLGKETAPGLVLAANGEAFPDPLALGLTLHFAAMPDPASNPIPTGGGLYGSEDVFRLIRRQLDADQIIRRIRAARDNETYLLWREQARHYDP